MFNEFRASTRKDEAMKRESGNGCARREMHLPPLNCALRNGYSVTFYSMHISSPLFTWQPKKIPNIRIVDCFLFTKWNTAQQCRTAAVYQDINHSHAHNVEHKWPDPKVYFLYSFIYTTFKIREN